MLTSAPDVADVADTSRHPVTRVLAHAALALCLVLAALSGPWVWLFTTPILDRDPDPAIYQGVITAMIVIAVLLAAGELAVLALNGHWVHHAMVVAGILLQAYLAGILYAHMTATVDPDLNAPGADSPWFVARATLLIPTSVPLELLLLGIGVRALLRAMSNRWPPSPQDP